MMSTRTRTGRGAGPRRSRTRTRRPPKRHGLELTGKESRS